VRDDVSRPLGERGEKKKEGEGKERSSVPYIRSAKKCRREKKGGGSWQGPQARTKKDVGPLHFPKVKKGEKKNGRLWRRDFFCVRKEKKHSVSLLIADFDKKKRGVGNGTEMAWGIALKAAL